MRKTIPTSVPFVVAALAASACLTRDVATEQPITRLSVTAAQDATKINKIDLLFAIDDSRSMGDKQEFLKQAVPVLLKRLVRPNCIDDNDKKKTSLPDAAGACAAGTKPEFEAITDIHIGVVSSSLGTAGDICWNTQTVTDPVTGAKRTVRSADSAEMNRHAMLFAPAGAGAPATEPAKFLSWQPDAARDFDPTPASAPYKTPETLNAAFQKFFDANSGVGQRGCGVEAQLESVYRFLIQPDPTGDSDLPSAARDAIANQILAQRKAFLRPDSLVAVVMLTDENDDSVDAAAFKGNGSRFSSFSFGIEVPGKGQSGTQRTAPYSGSNSDKGTTFPRALKACDNLKNATDEQLKACSSCVDSNVSAAAECQSTPYLAAENDSFNARYVRMKARYGLDPLFPLSRYVRGLSSLTVPSRPEEHDANGRYQVKAGTCKNPLFAAELPGSMDDETCALKSGVRTSDMVYFAIIGGVPQDLLRDAAGPKTSLSDADWVRILGKNPEAFDFDGIDPRMYELGTPRTAEALVAERVAASPAGIDEVRASVNVGKTSADPDFVLNDKNSNRAGLQSGFGADLNYACSFPIAERAVTEEDINGAGECNKFYPNEACTPSSGSVAAQRKQIRAKAYPTTRELSVARMMGERGIAASLCPLRITPRVGMTPEQDPDYGYNPAVNSIVERLKNRLNGRCLSQPLKAVSVEGEPVKVDCAFYELVADTSAASDGDCAARPGRTVASAENLVQFRAKLNEQGEQELSARQICKVDQLAVPKGETCLEASAQGWCYVQNTASKSPAEQCAQAIVFQKSTLQKGSPVRYQCLSP